MYGLFSDSKEKTLYRYIITIEEPNIRLYQRFENRNNDSELPDRIMYTRSEMTFCAKYQYNTKDVYKCSKSEVCYFGNCDHLPFTRLKIGNNIFKMHYLDRDTQIVINLSKKIHEQDQYKNDWFMPELINFYEKNERVTATINDLKIAIGALQNRMTTLEEFNKRLINDVVIKDKCLQINNEVTTEKKVFDKLCDICSVGITNLNPMMMLDCQHEVCKSCQVKLKQCPSCRRLISNPLTIADFRLGSYKIVKEITHRKTIFET